MDTTRSQTIEEVRADAARFWNDAVRAENEMTALRDRVAKLVERVAVARAMLRHSGNSPHCSSCAAANEIDAALDEFHGRKA
jgi:hypothetical protein